MAMVLALLLPGTASAQLAQQHSFNVRGDVEMVGNGLLTCSTSSGTDSTNCASHQNGTGNGAQNANRDMVYINTDPVGGSAPANSSTATVTMPAGAIVRSAGLYWSGRSGPNNSNRQNIWFKVPGGSYQQLTANAADLYTFTTQGDNGRRPYTAYRDVTSLVSTSGTYSVGGLTSSIGTGDGLGLFGGWALIITYEHSSKPFRRLMVFNASSALQVTNGNPASATVSGLLTPPAGNFNAYMGALVWEGDDGINGDQFNLSGAGVQNGGNLSDAQSPVNNFWNSRISRLGSLFTNRNPAYANNFAIDLKMVDISNVPANTGPRMANSGTTANLEFTSTGDVYFPHALVFISDLYSPNLLPSLNKTVANVSRPGATDVMPGEQLEYTISFQNTGQDGAIRIVATDPIPAGTTYVPGTLRVHRDDGLGINAPAGQARTDASGDDTAEFTGSAVRFRVGSGANATDGGMLALNQAAEVRFRVTVDAGFAGTQITNTVTVAHGSQTFPNDPDQNVSGSTRNDIPLAQNPHLAVTKTGPATAVVGVAYDYVVTVTNSGAAPTSAAATVTDTIPNGLTINGTPAGCAVAGQVVTCNVPSGLSNVAPNNTAVFTISVTPTAAAGASVTNTASVSGGGDPSCPVATPCISPPVDTALSAPNLTVAKVGVLDNTVVAPPGVSNVGDVINYTITVANTGTGAATGVNVADPKLATLACTMASVAQALPADIPAGESLVCAGAYTLTQLDIDAGQVENTATATGGNTCSTGCTGDETTPIAQSPALTVVKSVTSSGPYVLNSTISYSFVVTNTGNVALSNVSVNDALVGLSTISCPSTTLAVGANMTCTATYVVTAADVAAGNVHNSATATGTPPVTPTNPTPTPVVTPPSETDTPIAQAPAMTVVKSVTSTGPYAQGDTIAYSFAVTNTGNVALSNVTVNDALVGLSTISCPSTTLAVGANMTCTATYVVTAADVAAGNVHNSATATGTPPVTPTNPTPTPITTPPSETDTPIAQAPAMTVVKSVTSTGPYAQGDTIAYSFAVTNTGNVALSNVTVNDALVGLSTISCPSTTLAVGANMTCTATYVVTAADVAAGNVHNSATATGTPPVTPTNPTPTPITTPPSVIDTPIAQAPAMTVIKSVTSTGPYAQGDTIAYSFAVTNTGNVALSNVTVNDALVGLSTISCPSTTLAVGANMTCTATYVVTAADVAAGNVHNSATATGTPPVTPTNPTPTPITTPPSVIDTPIAQAPAMTVIKSVTSTGPYAQGDTIAYSFAVTNTGNVALSNVTVNDALVGLSTISCPSTTLAVGANMTCTATYVVTAADVAAGNVHNSATATGTPPVTPTNPTPTPITTPPSVIDTPIMPVIDAVNDSFGPVNGGSGATTPSVLDNDTLNGTPVNPAAVTLTPGTSPNPGLVMNPDGSITVAPNTPAGSYTYPYTICEITNPTNCDSAVATVTVTAPVIDAVNDSFGPVNGGSGATTPSVLDNDTLNGTPVNPAAVTLTPGTSPNPGLVMNPDGTITIAPNTPAGSYTYPYTICEITNPTNCDSAVATVTVTAPVIDAVNDSFGPVNGATGNPSAGNAYTNDTLNGVAVNAADITGTVTSPATPINGGPVPVLDVATGVVSVPAGTPAGSYTIGYQICEVLNPTNCDTATITVTVTAPVIDAVNDSFGPVNGGSGGTTPSVLDNDTLNGTPVNPAAVTLTPGTSPNPGLVMNPDGTITIAPNTPAGSYTYPYTICEITNPTNCDSAVATVTVTAPVIDAVNDSFGPVNGATGNPSAGNAYTNDTLNGVAVNAADITGTVTSPATPINGGPVPVLDVATGVVSVPAGTPAGSYTIGYQICEVLNPTNCDTATITVTVTAPVIDAVNDSFGPVNGGSGATTPSVLDNDTLNGTPVNPAAVTLTPGTSPNPGLVMNPDGTITIAPNTPAGSYTYPYTICEITNPTNCDSAVATVTVTAPVIDAVNDSFGPVNGATGNPSAGNAYTNDTLNGVAVNAADITGTVTSPATPINGGPVPVLDVATGVVSVPAGTPAGSYTISYRICENTNPSNCDDAVITVEVTAPVIDAVNDSFGPVGGFEGGTTPTVLGNDTLNGTPVNPAAVTLTPGTSPNPGLVMNPDGSITVAPNTPAGSYTYPYTICEITNPTNCDSAVATVTVTAPVIVATDDNFGPVNGGDGSTTPSVLGNDSVNGGTVDPSAVTLTPGTSPHPGLVMNPDGTITIAPGTPTGSYSYPYEICDRANPGNCASAVAVITVAGQEALRVTKTAAVREVRIGDLVRYTLTVENVGPTPVLAGSVIDTPPAGFTYVEGSLHVVDGDNAATVSGQHPLRFDGVDVAVGQSATLTYLMRVGAGVRPGTHQNQAQAYTRDGTPVSNIATAEVDLVADALLDDSLVFGKVFDDRDGDGWQDSAGLSGVTVQGGFAPGAYIANSTTVDRGQGHQPQADASSPLLHGIAIGSIGGRQSAVDPVERQQVVVRQRLKELAFTSDFVLRNDQGVTVRMDAAGNTTVEKSGDAAKGLNSAEPTVERKVAAVEGGYVVDYVIRNAGFDERGIPGVRIASVEGLLMETDQFGRYHLAGVHGGNWARGRNFILKVDPSTLPAGTEFTTDNPLLRRVTPGLPVRFDWGVKLPVVPLQGKEQAELELGEVIFAPGSAEVRAQYLPAIDAIAAKIEQYQGGEVVIRANGHTDAIALARAEAVKAALLEKVSAPAAGNLRVSVRTDVGDPESMVIGVDEGGYVLGLVLFDTDKSAIRPEFKPLLDRVAQVLDQRGEGVVTLIGHTDVRGSHAYNTALGMRRAKAVQEALSERLSPEVRARVRVDVRNEPTAPVGVKR